MFKKIEMENIEKNRSLENKNLLWWQTEITDQTSSQLIQIFPVEDNEGVLIGQEIEWFSSIQNIIGYDTIGSREVILVENRSWTKFYIYRDTHKVLRIHDKNWKSTWEYLWKIQERISLFWEPILRTTSNCFDSFMYPDTLQTYRYKNNKIYDIKQTTIGDKKVVILNLEKNKEVVDGETWEYLYAEHGYDNQRTKIIDIINDSKSPIIHLWDGSSLVKVIIEEENQTIYLDTKTLKIFSIDGIPGNIEDIEDKNYHIGNHQFLKCCIVDHTSSKYYYIHKDTWKLFTIPWTQYVVDWYAPGVTPTSKIRPITSGNKFLEYTLLSVFAHEIGDNKTHKRLFTIDQNSLQEVTLPWTDFVVSDVEDEPRNRITFGNKYYARVSIADVQREWQLYFSPEDNSIAHISKIDWEKHMLNNLGSPVPSYGFFCGRYISKPLSIWWREIVPAFINRGEDSILIDNQTFQEVVVNVSWTDEEINMIWHEVLDIGWEKIIQVWTKSWKTIYVYKKNLVPLQVAWITWYVEDINELEYWSRNMKIDWKFVVVKVK